MPIWTLSWYIPTTKWTLLKTNLKASIVTNPNVSVNHLNRSLDYFAKRKKQILNPISDKFAVYFLLHRRV